MNNKWTENMIEVDAGPRDEVLRYGDYTVRSDYAAKESYMLNLAAYETEQNPDYDFEIAEIVLDYLTGRMDLDEVIQELKS